MAMRIFFAEFKVNESNREEFERVFTHYTAMFRDHRGPALNYYNLMKDPADPGHAFVYEQWADDDAFVAHLNSPEYLELRQAIKNLGIERMTVSGFEADQASSYFDGTPEELPGAEELLDDGAA